LKVQPDPALVKVGDNVIWELSLASDRDLVSAEWVIYFRDKNPFNRANSIEWGLLTEATGADEHKLMFDAGPTREPGDFKYGVRIMNVKTGKQLSDDDPRLIVSS